MKRVFIVWEKECIRSENIAQHFNAEIIHIYPFRSKGSLFKTILRYFISMFITLYLLIKKKPKIVFVINLPFPLILTIYLFSRISKIRYILDTHSGAFTDNKWKKFMPIYKVISKNALLNINTCLNHSEQVKNWGGESYIISDVPVMFKNTINNISLPAKSIFVVCSYNTDEPIETIFEAAKRTPDVNYYFSGNYQLLDYKYIRNKPGNVTFIGYLPIEEYFSYLKSVRAILVLTKRDNTMQRGAYEALALEQPIITSNFNILVESFGNAAIYVNNNAIEIAKAVYLIIDNYDSFKTIAGVQKKLRLKVFESIRNSIEDRLTREIGQMAS